MFNFERLKSHASLCLSLFLYSEFKLPSRDEMQETDSFKHKEELGS